MVNNFIFPIEKMCKVLKVSRSSYYSWLVHEPGMREKENDELSKRIKMVYESSKRTYCNPRVTIALLEQGLHVSRQRVARLMKKQNLQCIIRKNGLLQLIPGIITLWWKISSIETLMRPERVRCGSPVSLILKLRKDGFI
jgi:hypothetical protein